MSAIFWEVTQYGMAEVHQRFGGRYDLHFQGRTVSQAGSKLRWIFIELRTLNN
jgi:hypothetical protein